MAEFQSIIWSNEHPVTVLVTSPSVHTGPYAQRVIVLLERSGERSVGVVFDQRFRDSVRRLHDALPLLERFPQGSAMPGLGMDVDVIVWGPGQLERELDRGLWMQRHMRPGELLKLSDNVWLDMVRSIGRSVIESSLRIPNWPDDPEWN